MEAAETQEVEETQEVTENAERAEGDNLETDDSEVGEEQEQEAEGEAVEPWMLDDDGDNEKPIKFNLKAKKRQRGELDAKNEENEALKARIAALEKPSPMQTGDLKRPDELDFETTEDYHRAIDDYHDKRYELRQQAAQQTQAQQEDEREVSEAVDSHYERADKLINEHGLKSENYKDADTRVRGAMEAIAPKIGNKIVDQFIKGMGEGSEKVLYHLGRNKTALSELQSIMQTDKSGIKAAIYLGKKLEQLTNPQRRKTKAPSPAPRANGDTGGHAAEALKRKYDAAHKKNDGVTAFKFKREAKKAGVDVSKW